MYKDFDTMISCGKCNTSNCNPRQKGSCGCGNAKLSEDNCQIKKHTWGIVNYPLAMVYAPLQGFDGLFDKETALSKGTMFEGLDLPFEGESVYKGGCCRG